MPQLLFRPGNRAIGADWVLLVVALAVLLGIASAVGAAWVCDDSFISFRYAENLVNGKGLVYNAGERVEGYTNPLWTLLIAASLWAGLSAEVAATALGIGCYVLLVACLLLWSLDRARQSRPFLPLAAMLVLVLGDHRTWATGGLETSLFTLLSVAGVLATLRPGRLPGGSLTAGSLLGLAVLTRPDGLLFAAVGVASTWSLTHQLPGRRRLARAAAVAAPIVVLAAGLGAFKLLYYGELLPTAYYSKSALSPYYSQGLIYLGLYLAKNWFLAPLALVLLWVSRRNPVGPVDREKVVLFAAGSLFTGYVVHSGGDFMFARRLIPAMPFLYLLMEHWLVEIPQQRAAKSIFATAVVLGLLPFPVYSGGDGRIRGISDEPSFYPPSVVEIRKRQAEFIGQALAGTDVRVMFQGGMCMFGYYSKLPYLAEMTGLTQYSLAKLPIEERGAIGHEKKPDARWLTGNRIHLIIEQRYPPEKPDARRHRFDDIHFSNLAKGKIWIYSEQVMGPLREDRRILFTPIEEVIEQKAEQMRQSTREEARAVYEMLDRYYFRWARGGERESARLRAIVRGRPSAD
ncbi:hypothetical protein N9166_01090 [bacterium]|nr:hypothetical protein [bacterium]